MCTSLLLSVCGAREIPWLMKQTLSSITNRDPWTSHINQGILSISLQTRTEHLDSTFNMVRMKERSGQSSNHPRLTTTAVKIDPSSLSIRFYSQTKDLVDGSRLSEGLGLIESHLTLSARNDSWVVSNGENVSDRIVDALVVTQSFPRLVKIRLSYAMSRQTKSKQQVLFDFLFHIQLFSVCSLPISSFVWTLSEKQWTITSPEQKDAFPCDLFPLPRDPCFGDRSNPSRFGLSPGTPVRSYWK